MNLSFDLTGDGVVPRLLYTITRVDGTIERVTGHEADIVAGGNTFTAMGGLTSGVLTQRNDGTPPVIGFNVTLTSAGKLRFRNVVRGKYERADVLVEICDAVDPGTPDFVAQMKMLGTIKYDLDGQAQFDLISEFSIPRDIFVGIYTLQCSYSFGDPLTCTMPIMPYVYGGDLNDVQRNEVIALGDRRRFRYAGANTPEDYMNVYWEATGAGTTGGSAPGSPSSTVDATVTDGGVTWTVRNSWLRAVRISATDGIRTLTLDRLPDPRASDSNWYNPSKIKFWDGDYAGRVFKGSGWDATAHTIQIYLPCEFAAVNDWAEITPWCDQTYEMCRDKFANTYNHGGYPFQLGAKAQAQALALT